METNNIPQTDAKNGTGTKSLFKGLIIAGLILALMIPMLFIKNLVSERATRQIEVVQEVSNKWSMPQTITGPILMVPYYEKAKNDKGQQITRKYFAYFLPDELNIDSRLNPEKRNRSLYDVYLFQTKNKIQGKFNNLPIHKIGLSSEQLIWQEARLVLGISDLRGCSSNVQVQFGDQKLAMEAGIPPNGVVDSGLSTPIGLLPGKTYSFDLTLNLKSSEYLHFAGWGNATSVTMNSTWPTPSFEGNYLPETSDVSNKGFQANWQMSQTSRPYPQQWKSNSVNIKGTNFGVKLVDPSDTYAKTERVVKYALLFICLTFAVFYLIEILQNLQIHPLQYILVGFALCVFYTLLLSISEYLGFNTAYAIAASATVALIGMYAYSMFNKPRISIAFTFGLACLYAYIFFLIQLEEMSLIFGSLALFFVLAAIMYFTRKINWYAISKPAI